MANTYKCKKDATVPPNPAREVFHILLFLIVHVVMIGVSYWIQQMHLHIQSYLFVVIGTLYLTIGSCVATGLMQTAMRWGTVPRRVKSQLRTDVQTKADVGPGVENNETM